MSIVQEFIAYCEQNDMSTDDTMSIAFFANHLKIRTGIVLPADQREDLLDFVSPDVPPTVCPVWAGR
jgi:hypothetical protein